jgi:LysW-gamma-L-lysine carboxypeptidase
MTQVLAPCGAATDEQAVEFLRGLVATPSLSGREHAAAAYCAERMAALGFDSRVDSYTNVIGIRDGGRADDGTQRTIVMLGHIDTVPGEIPVRIENGVLHGRGSVDAKGPFAACVLSAARFQPPKGVRVVVIGAAEEETPTSNGARGVVGTMMPDACIIAEPSGCDSVTIGYKGRLVVTARCERDNEHTAGPNASVYDVLHAWWGRVQARAALFNADSRGVFDAVQASIRGWESHEDGLRDSATLRVGFRLPPAVTPAQLEEVCRSEAGEERITISTCGGESAVVSDRTDLCAQALCGAIRARGGRPTLKLKTGTADMNVVAPVWKCPIVAYGPGDSALDHTPREHLRIEEYLLAVTTLERALANIVDEWSA